MTAGIPVTLIPGDGIGPEIVEATLATLDALRFHGGGNSGKMRPELRLVRGHIVARRIRIFAVPAMPIAPCIHAALLRCPAKRGGVHGAKPLACPTRRPPPLGGG